MKLIITCAKIFKNQKKIIFMLKVEVKYARLLNILTQGPGVMAHWLNPHFLITGIPYGL